MKCRFGFEDLDFILFTVLPVTYILSQNSNSGLLPPICLSKNVKPDPALSTGPGPPNKEID